MSIAESAENYLRKIWLELEEPLVISLSTTIWFLIAVFCLKIGVMMLYFLFSDKCWFNIYIDAMSIATLILTYIFFLVVRLKRYYHNERKQMKRADRGENL